MIHVESLVVVEEFLAQWKERARKHYLDLMEEYWVEYKKKHEISAENLRCIRSTFSNKLVYSEEKIEEILKLTNEYDLRGYQSEVNYMRFKIWKNKHSKVDIDIASRNDIEYLEKFLNREVESKRETLMARVEKKAGNIIDAKGLYIGVNGEINGFVVGSVGRVEVRTIYAGGFNIQCLHYRVLIK